MSDSAAPCPWNSPGQNTGVGGLSLLQGIFPTQGSNPGLPHWRQILYQLSHKGSPWIQGWVAYPFSQRIFLTQESNPGLLHFGQTFYQLSHKGSPTLQMSCAKTSSSQQVGAQALAFLLWSAPAGPRPPGLPHGHPLCGHLWDLMLRQFWCWVWAPTNQTQRFPSVTTLPSVKCSGSLVDSLVLTASLAEADYHSCRSRAASVLSHVWLFATPWTVAHPAPLSMRFPRQEYWGG